MAVSLSADFEMRGGGGAMILGADGTFVARGALAEDASGGSLTITLSELAMNGRPPNRWYKIRGAQLLGPSGAAAVRTGQMLINDKFDFRVGSSAISMQQTMVVEFPIESTVLPAGNVKGGGSLSASMRNLGWLGPAGGANRLLVFQFAKDNDNEGTYDMRIWGVWVDGNKAQRGLPVI